MKRTVTLFVSIVGMLLSVTLMPGASRGEMLGAGAPDFVLTDSEGCSFQLSKKLDKHVVLVHMQVFCYECRQEVPLINQIVGVGSRWRLGSSASNHLSHSPSGAGHQSSPS